MNNLIIAGNSPADAKQIVMNISLENKYTETKVVMSHLYWTMHEFANGPALGNAVAVHQKEAKADRYLVSFVEERPNRSTRDCL